MYRLGLAEMKGDLNLSRNIRDGHKWLKRSAEAATPQYPHALHELALLHEKGVDSIIFVDLKYAVSLYHEAAVLGYAPSAYRLGECYEFGKLDCKTDASLSIQYYSIAAEQNHPESCFALTAWYLVGVPNLLPSSDEQAYAWAMCAAQSGLPRAEYAVGYFTEMGIGALKDENNAMQWYQKAAQHGEKRAIQRLQPHTLRGVSDNIDNSINSSKKKNNKPLSSINSSTSNISQQSQTPNSKRMSFLSFNSADSSNNSRQSSFIYKATSFLRRPSSQK
jgi:TPR repeat protein